jgi:hypothetical protein
VLVAGIVAVDVLLLRHDFWSRLMANIGIVLFFGAIYWEFVRR